MSFFSFAGYPQSVVAVALSPDGKTLASGGLGRDIRLWRVATGARVASLTTPVPISSLTFSTDGKTLAAGGMDRSVHLWRVEGNDLAFHLD